jgi:uncharacterized phage protein gp47/JayE
MASSFGTEGVVYDKYADIKAGMEEKAISELGASINLQKDSLFGHLQEVVASGEALANEIGQQVYDSNDVANSTGAMLDGNVAHVGVSREGGSYSTIAQLQFTAEKACIVPSGTRVRTNNNVNFATDSQITFTGPGTQEITATCTVKGPVEADIEEVSNIVNPINGITEAKNLTAAIPGTYRQTEAQLKYSHTLAVATSGEDDVAGMYEALYKVSVSAVRIIDNDTEIVSAEDGKTPPHHIRAIVIGGSDNDVAEAINNNRTSGVGTYGDESVVVYNATYGYTKTIMFDRGSEVSTTLYINLTKYKNFPANGELLIADALANVFETYTLGSTVDHAQCVGACYAVSGLKVNSLSISKDGAASIETDVSFDADELPTLDVTRDAEDIVTQINIVWSYS